MVRGSTSESGASVAEGILPRRYQVPEALVRRGRVQQAQCGHTRAQD